MRLPECRLRLLCASDLSLILSWRNHPDVRRWMYTSREIPSQEHMQWYERVSKDDTRTMLVYECDQVARGFANLHKISNWGLGEWGFYVAPDAAKGTGRALGVAVLRYAFETLNLYKLCSEVIEFNAKSLRFHEMLGFQCEGILRDQYFDGSNYQNVHCFGLLASEWRSIYLKSDV